MQKLHKIHGHGQTKEKGGGGTIASPLNTPLICIARASYTRAVSLSVFLSQAGIESKQTNVGLYDFHHRVAYRLQIFVAITRQQTGRFDCNFVAGSRIAC